MTWQIYSIAYKNQIVTLYVNHHFLSFYQLMIIFSNKKNANKHQDETNSLWHFITLTILIYESNKNHTTIYLYDRFHIYYVQYFFSMNIQKETSHCKIYTSLTSPHSNAHRLNVPETENPFLLNNFIAGILSVLT